MTTLAASLSTLVALVGLSSPAWAAPGDVVLDEIEGSEAFEEEPEAAVEDEVDETPVDHSAIGIGYQRTIAAFRGPQLEYHLGRVMLNGTLGIETFAPDGGERGSAIGLSAGAFYKTVDYGKVALYLGVRMDVAYAGENFAGVDSTTEFALELPLRFQAWITESLALHWETGLAFSNAGDGGSIFSNSTPGSVNLVVGAADLLGQAGFVVYWP